MNQKLLTLFFAFCSAPTFADVTYYSPSDYPAAWVGIADHAKNGCWTNIGETKTYAEDQMAMAGFNVIDEPVIGEQDVNPILSENGVALWITVHGVRLSNGLCVGYIDAKFYAAMKNPNRPDLTFVGMMGPSFAPYSVWSDQNFNTYALDHIKDFIPVWVGEGVVDDTRVAGN